MTTTPSAKNDDRALTIVEPHKQSCICWRVLKRSLMACQTCQWFDRAITRLEDEKCRTE